MSGHVRFRDGGTAYVSASLAMPFVSRFAVFGSRGWIEIRDKAHVEAPAGWVVTSAMADGPITVTEVPPAEPVKDNLIAFARAVRGEAPLSHQRGRPRQQHHHSRGRHRIGRQRWRRGDALIRNTQDVEAKGTGPMDRHALIAGVLRHYRPAIWRIT